MFLGYVPVLWPYLLVIVISTFGRAAKQMHSDVDAALAKLAESQAGR
jgi:hypothetical protein